MIKTANILDQWQVEYNSGIPVYRQIINQVCAGVAADVFKPGEQLPTIRALSERLNVNPNTVAKAYRELELKGVILSERGSGSFIQAQAPTPPTEATSESVAEPAASPEPAAGGKKARLTDLYQRLLADMAGSGLTEHELLNFIKEQNPNPKPNS
jgi:GntR family transcriptional regulator